jgi:tetratricopeptide (TPR) repeat protein
MNAAWIASRRWVAVLSVLAIVVAVGSAVALRPRVAEVIVPEFDTSQAFPQVDQAVKEAVAKVKQSPKSGWTWGRLGMLAMAHNFNSQAAECFARTAELLPTQFQWAYYRGILAEATALSAALERYDEAVGLSPHYAPLRLRRARLLMRLNRLDDAEREFRVAAEEEADSPYPRIGLGRLELVRGNLDEAREHFESAVKLGPWSRDSHLELAQVLNRQGNASEAYREQQIASRLPAVAEDLPDPVLQDIEEMELTGRRISREADDAIRRGDLNSAVALLRQVIRERPDLSRPRLNLGQVLQFQGKSQEAVEVFQEAAQEFPQEALAQFSLGTAFQMAGRQNDAATAYREALRIKPDYADAWFGLGMLLRQEKDFPAAADALKQAASVNPGFAPCHVVLALCLEELGELAEAVKELRLAVKLAPQDREAQRQLERLLEKSPPNQPDTSRDR